MTPERLTELRELLHGDRMQRMRWWEIQCGEHQNIAQELLDEVERLRETLIPGAQCPAAASETQESTRRASELLAGVSTVYLCGPVSGRERRNVEAFFAAAHVVRHVRDIISPHLLVPLGAPEADAMLTCLRVIATTEGLTVVCLPDWRTSLGCAVEVALARKLGVPVVEIDGDTLRVVQFPHNSSGGPRCVTSNEPPEHRESKEDSTDA